MRLVHSAPDLVELRGRDGIGAPLLVGSALLVPPTLAALVAATPMTHERMLVALALAAIAIGLIRLGWPRLHQIRISPLERTVQVDRRPRVPLGADPLLHLVAAPAERAAGPQRYGAALEWRDGAPLLLLAADEPATVLRELAALRTVLPLRMSSGWGLPAQAPPWVDAVAKVGSGLPIARKSAPTERDARRRVTTTMVVGCVAVATLLAMEIRGRLSQGDMPSSISLVLPALGLLALTAITIAIGRTEHRLGLGSELVYERRLWTLPLARRTIPRSAIRHAYLVSPRGADPRHLVLDTSDGPIAFPCESDDGVRVTAELGSGGEG